jgi:hypothetical protein
MFESAYSAIARVTRSPDFVYGKICRVAGAKRMSPSARRMLARFASPASGSAAVSASPAAFVPIAQSARAAGSPDDSFVKNFASAGTDSSRPARWSMLIRNSRTSAGRASDNASRIAFAYIARSSSAPGRDT